MSVLFANGRTRRDDLPTPRSLLLHRFRLVGQEKLGNDRAADHNV
jgi:hypothetical protein